MNRNQKSAKEQINLEKKRLINVQKETPFHFKPSEEIKYTKKFPDNKSVFYYPLKKNFMSNEEEKKYNHYYGEEYVDRVSRIDKLNKKVSYLQDDIITNLIFLDIICSKTSDFELIKSIKSVLKMKCFSRNDILKRIKILYDRYHKFLDESKSIFWYMSCKMHEKKNILTLFQNNKQTYCNIDLIYDCSLHSSIDPNFDNPSCYDQIKYLKTYKKLLEHSFIYLYGDNQINNNMAIDSQTENENNEESYPMSLSRIDDKKNKDKDKEILNNINNLNNNNNDLVSNASSKILSYTNSKDYEELNNEIILENKDGSNKIDHSKLEQIMVQICMDMGAEIPSKEDVEEVLDDLDEDGDKEIEVNKFKTFIKDILKGMIE